MSTVGRSKVQQWARKISVLDVGGEKTVSLRKNTVSYLVRNSTERSLLSGKPRKPSAHGLNEHWAVSTTQSKDPPCTAKQV